MTPRIAIMGEPGSNSEEACIAVHGPGSNILFLRDLEEVFDALARGQAEGAVIPVENSRAGTVAEAYEFLLKGDWPILGEYDHPVHHYLMAPRGRPLEAVKTVYSHPQALMQCRGFITKHHMTPIPYYDTAGSAKHVASLDDPAVAAIAPRRSADLYDLDILAETIEDDPNNTTRFYVLGVPPRAEGPHRRTVIAFGIDNKPGRLLACLTPLAERHINMSKLESRPGRDRPFEYTFYAILDSDVSSPDMQDALRLLEEETVFLKLLGSFTCGSEPKSFHL